MSTALRRTAIVVAVAAAISVPAIQAAFDLGLSAAEFAGPGNTTLRAAGYAFSIWGPIYIALAAYAAFQTRARESPALATFGWPSAVATTSCAAWIVASSLNARPATVAIILAGAVSAILPLLKRVSSAGRAERLLVMWPNTALAGWLTIASLLNAVTVLTAEGLIPAAGADASALSAAAVLTVGAAWVALRARSAIYLLPIAWGLAAVFVAERPDRILVAGAAATCAAALLALAAFIAVRWRREGLR